MHQSLSTEAFNYSSLDAETLQFVQQRGKRIKLLMRRTAQDIVEIGQQLVEIKEKLGHGCFEDWLKAEFDWTQMTANRFMNVAKKFESNNLLDLSIAPSALYLLAAPSTPKVAREEAIARAGAGEQITHKVAQEIVKEKKQGSPLTGTISKRTRAKPKQAVPEGKVQGITYSSLVSDFEAKEQFQQKPEILAVRPKQIVQPASDAKYTGTVYPSLTPKIVQPGSWWKLGSKHFLYCGHPSSARFQERLPEQIALSLAFPRSRDSWLSSPGCDTKSAFSLFSIYQDQDLDLLRGLVKSALELYTESSETVVFSFLNDPSLLTIAHQLKCQCFIAEPEAEFCDDIVAAWRHKELEAEEIRSLRF